MHRSNQHSAEDHVQLAWMRRRTERVCERLSRQTLLQATVKGSSGLSQHTSSEVLELDTRSTWIWGLLELKLLRSELTLLVGLAQQKDPAAYHPQPCIFWAASSLLPVCNDLRSVLDDATCRSGQPPFSSLTSISKSKRSSVQSCCDRSWARMLPEAAVRVHPLQCQILWCFNTRFASTLVVLANFIMHCSAECGTRGW